jgi:type IV pilus assembly protein PilY1
MENKFKKAIVALVILLQITAPASAIVSKNPPLFKANIPANVMFMLDNSGSMRWEQMPDGIVGDADKYDYGYLQPKSVYRNGENAITAYTEFEIYNKGALVTDMQARRFRSPEVNKIYYNPDLLYEPWSYQDGSSYPPADVKKVKYNPELPAGVTTALPTVDLTVPLTGTYAGAYIATYYRYIGGGTCPTLPSSTSTLLATEKASCYSMTEIRPTVLTYPRSAERTDCSTVLGLPGSTCTYQQELQNYANWFQYWRSRILIARGGVGKAFAKQGTALRVGWGEINKRGSNDIVISGVRNDFNGANRLSFFDYLYKNNYPENGTDLRYALERVGKYFESDQPWLADVNVSTSTKYSCRQNFNILMTDGYWNGTASTLKGNYDGNDGPVHTPLKPLPNSPPPYLGYKKEAPFADDYSWTLADIAMYYWQRDLRPDLSNNVPMAAKSRIDPAFWQHLVNFTVGLGVSGTLPYPDSTKDLTDGTLSWPKPVAESATAVDDLWHAAVNSRGIYYNAANPTQFAKSLESALEEISARSGSASAVGTSSTTLGTGVKIYTSSYNTDNWSGELIQKALHPTTGLIVGDDWKASEKFPKKFEDRKIYSLNSVSKSGIKFEYGNLSPTDKAVFDVAAISFGSVKATATSLVDYIRGDRAFEKNTKDMPYRIRLSVLGDLVGSDPQYVKEGNDEGYDFLPSTEIERDSYRNFLVKKKNRAATVYVGANDGMLHAFDATAGSTGGTERFAYVPQGVIKNLPALASPEYTHQFYVNSTPLIKDAYINNEWKTILIGSTGAGGKSVFALDVTDPTDFSESKVLWERNEAVNLDIPAGDLGYSFGTPQIGKMKDGKWVAIYGNGYDSANGKSSLLVVDLATGSLIKKIDTGIGVPSTKFTAGSPNGMSTPRILQGTDTIIKAVYAGDLQGIMWKFDFMSKPTVPKIAFSSAGAYINGQPLFAAQAGGIVQAITNQPQIYPHPLGGYLVTFGTGKIFESEDASNVSMQSLYGLWDKQDISAVTPTPITGGTSLLQKQTFSVDSKGFYQISDIPVVWTDEIGPPFKPGKRGWYIDLNSPNGERVVTNPLILDDQVIFTTLIPGTSTDPCISNAQSGLLQISPINGGPLTYKTIDTNGDGVLNTSDLMVSGKRDFATFGTTIIRRAGGKGSVWQNDSESGEPNDSELSFSGKRPNVRIWRQLLNRQ